jgi:hypothetical protein
MSDTDPTSVDPIDPTTTAGGAAGGPPADEPPGAEAGEDKPWYQNPVIIAAVVIALLAVAGLAWWGASDNDKSGDDSEASTEELVVACLAQNGAKSDQACAELASSLTDEEKAEFTRRCTEGDLDACRLLELIGEPVPTPPTTTTTPPAGDTVIVIPPPAPGEPTPPDPTIPDLPDPSLDELADACLAQDGSTSDLACQYLQDNLTDSQKDEIRQECADGNEEACRLLELIGEEPPDSSTSTTAA